LYHNIHSIVLKMNTDNSQSQMRKGVLELCILSILAKEDSYVPDIIDKLKESKLIVVEGTLYPLMTRLKNDGFLTYNWVESRSGPPRKYYKLTPLGKSLLKDQKKSWVELVESVDKIIREK
jgi:PadR family transcriptional regulator, regulatory protein PadR